MIRPGAATSCRRPVSLQSSFSPDILAGHRPGHNCYRIGHLEVAGLDDSDSAPEALNVDTVGDLEHLRHVVADQDDGESPVTHLTDQVEHHVRLFDAER